VNPKSGGQIGAEVVQNMYKVLNPCQVFDLSAGGPIHGVKFMLNNPKVQWRVLACGGDGTVAWVLSVIDKFDFAIPPPVGVIPLGTGNDLARTLGWGGGFSDPTTLASFLPNIQHLGVTVKLDRWILKVKDLELDEGEAPPSDKIVNNYFSIGIDAKVAFQFHTTRNKKPYYFSNQTVNKMWYAKFGTEAIMDGCSGLEQTVKITIDGQRIPISTPLEAIVVVNLPSCYGGAFLWEFDKVMESATCGSDKKITYSPLSIEDKKLEVVGIKNSVHLGQVQMGMSSPVFIGQGANISLSIGGTDPLPVQIDGEPWLQAPSTIEISHLGQATMFASKDKAHKTLGLRHKE